MAEELQAQAAAEAASQTNFLDDIVESTRLKPTDEAYSVTKTGLQTFLAELVKPKYQGAKISGDLVDMMIAELDSQLSDQVNEIIHNKDFKELESTWRGLKFLVDRTDFRENVKIEAINLKKQDLIDDFDDAPEITKSGLYRTVYTAEYGQFGGQPYGAMIADYDFGAGPQDMKLLKNVAAVAAMSHAPFISAAGASFFGIESWDELAKLKDLHSVFEGAQYAKWKSFRESEDARYVALTLPRFLLRLPYGQNTQPCKLFNYKESTDRGDSDFCWGNTAFAFASRLTDSFAKYRWCANIIGPQSGGAVEDLPLYQYEENGEVKNKIPTQVLISERREFELADEGFIALTMRKGSDNATFFSANSTQAPKRFPNTPEGKEQELNYRLSTQMPYMMVIDRLAHYIKVLQRENIGSWKNRGELEAELNKWASQYVTEMDNPEPSVRSRRPLRSCEIKVSDVAGDPGWYQVSMKVRPHFKYMGASFTLSLVGKLDKK
ncbi:MAG: type VI secretion system contractile sheath large subunit [Succinivibrionaceae bacterium]